MDLQAILTAVESWSPRERLEWIDRIWEGLPEGERPDVGLTEEQVRELDRRLAAAERDPQAGAPWGVDRMRVG